jgi:glycosyltransferase involved in cell wall biosynthesis
LNRCLSVFVRSNPVVSDPRVEKEVHSLRKRGYGVVVLGWDREGKFRGSTNAGDSQTLRFEVAAPYNRPVLVFYYPLFWLWTLMKLLRCQPAVIHVCDLDSAVPAVLCRFLRRRTRVVFDVFDTYTLLLESKSKLLANFVRPFERLMARLSDGFITVSENRLEFFKGVPLKVAGIVMNCPPLDEHPTSSVGNSPMREGCFRVVYAGTVAANRGLVEVAQAVKGLKGVEFLVAGRVVDKRVLAGLRGFSNVRYMGQVSFSDALKLQKDANVIPLLYNLSEPINRVASPNKLFEAMMLGVPVITNLSGSLVMASSTGVFVDYHDVAGIRKAISFLRECPGEGARMGLSGRVAFEREYNWSVMEKRLFEVYDRVLSQ